MKSLQSRLSVAVSIVAAVLALVAGVGSFTAAFEQAQEVQDRRLKAIAHLFAGYELPTPQQLRSGPEAKFDAYVAVEPVGGTPAGLFNLPSEAPDEYQTATIGGEAWRIFVYTVAGTGRRFAVGQRTVIRNSIALHAGLWTAIPLLMMVPILCGVIFLLVRRMLKPIAALSSGLDRRTEGDLSPLRSDGLPNEIVPMVAAIDSLLSRLGRSMETKRHFIADAAHELRSPLATLSIQVENVCKLVSEKEAVSRLQQLQLGMARVRSLVEKLLDLARAQTPGIEKPESCHVVTTLRSVLEELLPVANERNVEIYAEHVESLSVAMSELDLTLILRNLLDNAIRYCNAAGIVEVGMRATEQGVSLEIKDNGPGIPLPERERIFDPFYRILGSGESGSGLGLSIVKTIVQRLDGAIDLAWTTDRPPTGLKIQVLLPVRAQSELPPPRNSARFSNVRASVSPD